jgi:hypothetical protein
MKLLTKEIGCLLIDCGSVRRQTKGMPIGFFFEGAPAPYQWQFYG